MNLETPLYKLEESELNSVYDPAEDTFLLLDVLSKDYTLLKSLKPLIGLEVGCGSGVVTTFLLKHQLCEFAVSTDINPLAVEVTLRTAQLNGVAERIIPVLTDLTKGLSPPECTFDLIVFNPPYVPTETSELNSDDLLTKSWAGGVQGREVTDRFLQFLPRLLSRRGVFYLVALDSNDIPQLLQSLSSQFRAEIVLTRRCGAEKLSVLRYQWISN